MWLVILLLWKWKLLSCAWLFATPWNSSGQNSGVGSLSLLQGIFPTQGLNPGLTALQADSLPAEPQGKPRNTGVGSLSLLQWIFPTQESKGLLHCWWILYQLSYWGSPLMMEYWFIHTSLYNLEGHIGASSWWAAQVTWSGNIPFSEIQSLKDSVAS